MRGFGLLGTTLSRLRIASLPIAPHVLVPPPMLVRLVRPVATSAGNLVSFAVVSAWALHGWPPNAASARNSSGQRSGALAPLRYPIAKTAPRGSAAKSAAGAKGLASDQRL